MKNKANHTQVNLFLDFALTIAFLVLLQPFHSGLLIHEWLGLALGGAIVVHMALHWRWIVALTKKFSGKVPAQSRIYYVLDAMLLITFLIILISGILISEVALPIFALRGTIWLVVGSVHEYVSYLTLALLVIKLALHWKWITHAVEQYIFGGSRASSQPVKSPSAAPTLTPVARANLKDQISRRRFLVIGCSTLCVAAVAGTCAHLRQEANDEAEETADAEPLENTSSTTSVSTSNVEPTAVPTPVATTTEAPATDTTIATPEASRPNSVRTRCPHGLVNDPYPGRCHRYTDQNGNNICDLSETT
ncbi:MAG: DUF4405 domain-containing protein [Anaerolineae bacterium]|nr:DUF4405 domain-containing protein [Anaerolineae bacterium]